MPFVGSLAEGEYEKEDLLDRFQDLARQTGLDAYVPSPKMCTDNASMDGAVALKKFAVEPAAATGLDLDAYARA